MERDPRFEDSISWLLDAKTPSIRYLALTTLQGLAEGAPEAAAARDEIPTALPVQAILEAQQPGGFWIAERHFYSPKYRSSHWSMLLLTELMLDPSHPKFQQGANYMLERVFRGAHNDSWLFKNGVGCFWGNWLCYQLTAGNISDERVQEIIQRTCEDIYRDGKCKYNNGLPCAWGIVRDLFGLALIPKGKRSRAVQDAIESGIHFLLKKYELLRADYPHEEKIHPIWSKLSFPLFYQADVLFVLRLMKELGALNNPGAQEPLQWLREKTSKNGRWRGGSPYRSRTWPFLDLEDTVNHWLTLHALQVLAD
jgi:hypothetical protein